MDHQWTDTTNVTTFNPSNVYLGHLTNAVFTGGSNVIIGRETNLSTQLSSYSPYTIQDSILTKHTTFHIAGYTITGIF